MDDSSERGVAEVIDLANNILAAEVELIILQTVGDPQCEPHVINALWHSYNHIVGRGLAALRHPANARFVTQVVAAEAYVAFHEVEDSGFSETEE